MISLIDVVRLLSKELPKQMIYPLEYPVDAPDSALVVEMSSNAAAKAKVFDLMVQVKVRETHPILGEKTSYEIRKFLENKTDFILGDTQVVFVRSENPVPLFMGKDSSGNHLYINNFRFVINEGAF